MEQGNGNKITVNEVEFHRDEPSIVISEFQKMMKRTSKKMEQQTLSLQEKRFSLENPLL